MIQASHSYSLQSLNLNPQILQSEGMCRGHCGEAKEFNLSQTSWCPLLCLRGRNCMISVSDLNNFREGQNKPSSMQPQGRSLLEAKDGVSVVSIPTDLFILQSSQGCRRSWRKEVKEITEIPIIVWVSLGEHFSEGLLVSGRESEYFHLFSLLYFLGMKSWLILGFSYSAFYICGISYLCQVLLQRDKENYLKKEIKRASKHGRFV